MNVNPISRKVDISYTLSKASVVQLKIFNAQGQAVKMLIDKEKQNAGLHSYSFTMAGLGNKVCFARFSDGLKTETVKVVTAE